MSPECRIETAIPRPLSAAAAEPFPQGSTLIPFGMEICEVQIVSPCQATMCLRNTNYEKNGVQSAMSPSAIRNRNDTILFSSEQKYMYVFYVHVSVQCNKFIFNKTKRSKNFSKFIFVKKLYMFRAVPLSIIRRSPLYIRHWYVIKLAWHIPVPNVQCITPDDGQRICP